MYKIYINNSSLVLKNSKDVTHSETAKYILKYPGKKKFLHNYIDKLEKLPINTEIVLHHHDLQELWDTFVGLYKVIEAAGGVVYNDNKILSIFRRGNWDLPKGKIEKGESKNEAAVREVQEETGIKQIEIQELITTTYHTYVLKEKRVLKVSYWYKMKTEEINLIPQTEEDIEIAEWKTKEDLMAQEHIYSNIIDILGELK
jgi:8-oxo-dGTP pyrophosphatase MutT (NUDIX family)